MLGTDSRFLLWVDAIGGYLVCMAPRVAIGRSVPQTNIDIPVASDISRIHATFIRDPEGWLLEAVKPVTINGRAIGRTLLRPNDRIILGTGCELSFHQPVPLSATAQLRVVSGHRLPHSLDSVFLMADTLILGPGSQSHVEMSELRQPVVLCRNKDGLGIRHQGNFSINGGSFQGKATLAKADDGRLVSHIKGDDFAFAVEPVRW